MTDTALTLNDVTKRFGSHTVLNGISLEVPRGETVAFLGRSGAGKTTTLRLMIGLLKPDDGLISVLGLNPQRDALEILRRTGYLAEDQQMFGWMMSLVMGTAAFLPDVDSRSSLFWRSGPMRTRTWFWIQYPVVLLMFGMGRTLRSAEPG